MGYASLYAKCQELGTPSVSRGRIHPLVLSETGIPKVRHIITELDTTVCRGMYFSAQNEEARFVQQVGCHVIVTARGLNDCWQRFVFVKELMHTFDDPREATDSGDVFDLQLQDLTGPSRSSSPQGDSEFRSFWMALALLCPEDRRLMYKARLEAKQIDPYAIALALRIPQLYVPRLFEPRYDRIIEELKST